MPCAGDCYIQQAALFGVREIFHFRQQRLLHHRFTRRGREAVATALQPEHNHVIRLLPFAGMDGHKVEIELRPTRRGFLKDCRF
ncbi:hypothetical protein D3C71_1741480 [compost metagenome]